MTKCDVLWPPRNLMQCHEIILIPKIIIIKYEIFLGTWKVIFHFLKKDKNKKILLWLLTSSNYVSPGLETNFSMKQNIFKGLITFDYNLLYAVKSW